MKTKDKTEINERKSIKSKISKKIILAFTVFVIITIIFIVVFSVVTLRRMDKYVNSMNETIIDTMYSTLKERAMVDIIERMETIKNFGNGTLNDIRDNAFSVSKVTSKLYQRNYKGNEYIEYKLLGNTTLDENLRYEISILSNGLECIADLYEGMYEYGLGCYYISDSGIQFNINSSGKLLENADVREMECYQKVKENREYAWYSKIDLKSDYYALFYPVLSEEDGFLGEVIMLLDNDFINEYVFEINKKTDIDYMLFIFDDNVFCSSVTDIDYKKYQDTLNNITNSNLNSQVLEYAVVLEETGWELKYYMFEDFFVLANAGMGMVVKGIMNEMLNSINWYYLAHIVLQVLVIIISMIIIIKMIKKIATSIASPIVRLTDEIENIGNGNFDYRVIIEDNDEIGMLGESFNRMNEQLKEYVNNITDMTKSADEINSQINTIKEIYNRMKPAKDIRLSEGGEINLFAKTDIAVNATNDFYDYFYIDSKYICISMGETKEKGMIATMISIIVRTYVKAFVFAGYSPSRILTEINRILMENSSTSTEFTLFLGIINTETRTMKYSYAGNINIMIKRSGEGFEALYKNDSLALAIMENVPYEGYQTSFSQGDILCMYSSGIFAQKDEKGNEFVENEFIDLLTEGMNLSLNMENVGEYVMDKMACFRNNAEMVSNVTLFLIKIVR